jgi:hypothetical protein
LLSKQILGKSWVSRSKSKTSSVLMQAEAVEEEEDDDNGKMRVH